MHQNRRQRVDMLFVELCGDLAVLIGLDQLLEQAVRGEPRMIHKEIEALGIGGLDVQLIEHCRLIQAVV